MMSVRVGIELAGAVCRVVEVEGSGPGTNAASLDLPVRSP